VTSIILDAGAFVAVDRNDRAMIARLLAASRHGIALRTNAMVVSQVWRDPRGRQVQLATLLRAVDVRAIEPRTGQEAGALLGLAGTTDPIDATVVLVAEHGDRIVTSDPHDIGTLVIAVKRHVIVVPC
jgi:hypothetical protein